MRSRASVQRRCIGVIALCVFGSALLVIPTAAGADGQSWSTVASPNPGVSYNYLSSVSCVNASDCTAVGNYYDGTRYATLIERWNGTTWTVTSPNPGTASNILNSVSCVSATDCTAVGYYDDGTRNATLVLQSIDPNPPTTTTTTSPNDPVVPVFTG